MKVNFKKSLLGACVAPFLMTGAHAAGLEEIVVTATKRSKSIQDVPFSINAQTAKDIQRAGATNIEELSRNVAGLAIQNLGCLWLIAIKY